jgi:radical SAM protein with 4Fe4S-binding SPASM domain
MTCFTEEFIPVFRNLGITAVGTSYDPEPNIRGPGSPNDSEWYNRTFMKKLALLESSGFGWGMIYVVTKRSLDFPLNVFFFLTNLLLTGGVNLNPVLIYDEERRDIAVTPEEYADFLGAIFPVWWKHRSRYPDLDPFRTLYANIIDGRQELGCVDSGKCTYHHVNVTPDGETSQCGRSADWGLLQYGNIRKLSLSQILRHPERDQLKRRVELLPEDECRKCRFWELCHGGCPLDAYSRNQSFMHKSEWCDAKQKFITKYFEPISGVKFEPANRP